MKLIITGHGRHGKDTVGKILQTRFNLSFQSSSWVAAEKVCRPYLAARGITYDSLQECYDDRHNYREEWYTAILEYNTPDKSRLCREVFSEHDLYVGMRDREEFIASRQFADLTIWVEAMYRVGYVDPTCKVLPGDCDITIRNNGTEAELETKLERLIKWQCL